MRRPLGSLSEPGIFQGPGETVLFLPAAPLVLMGRLGRLSPRPASLVRGCVYSASPCCLLPLLWRSASSLPLPFACRSEGAEPGERAASLSADLLLLGGRGSASATPSPSAAPCFALWLLRVDQPQSLLALPLPPHEGALLPWLPASGLGSSGDFWGLLERSFLPSPLPAAAGGTSRGGRCGGSAAKWGEGEGMARLSMGGATSDRLGEAVGRASHGAALSGTHRDAVRISTDAHMHTRHTCMPLHEQTETTEGKQRRQTTTAISITVCAQNDTAEHQSAASTDQQSNAPQWDTVSQQRPLQA